jgi:hypothetical protein
MINRLVKIKDIIQEAPPKFYGSQCTKDCSGHKAGYDWSNKKTHKDCDSNSPSFTKGCLIAKKQRDKK